MKSSKKRDRSFYVLLMKNYIIFTLVMGVLMVIVYFLEVLAEESIMMMPRTDRPLGGVELLLQGNYEELDMKKLLGAEGYFEVLDEENRVIFTDNPDRTALGPAASSYSEREVEFIPEYRTPYHYNRIEYTTGEGEKEVLVTKSLDEWDTGYHKEIGYMLLDEELQIIAGNLEWEKEGFTLRELNFLTQEQNAGYDSYKFVFREGEEADRTLIMHVKRMDRVRYKKLTAIWKIFVPVYLAVYVVVMLLFSINMHKRVKEPLDMLNEGILSFARGKRDTEISYKGPKEFEAIFDSFNIMARQLRESENAKEQLIVEKQRMLADISHDLKTPITVIQGYARAISDGLISKETQKQYLDTIFVKTENLTELINTFYDYSKLEHPEFKLVRKKQDVAEYIREYLASKYDEIELMGFLLEVEIPEEPVEYDFDEVQLGRVFDNILSNALKHNPAGTTVYVTLQQTEKSIRIEIGDNGAGIPEEVKAVIFEPFTVGDASRHNRQSSGLGLAVAKKIVELHGGALFLEEAGNPVISTLFVIRLIKL